MKVDILLCIMVNLPTVSSFSLDQSWVVGGVVLPMIQLWVVVVYNMLPKQ